MAIFRSVTSAYHLFSQIGVCTVTFREPTLSQSFLSILNVVRITNQPRHCHGRVQRCLPQQDDCLLPT